MFDVSDCPDDELGNAWRILGRGKIGKEIIQGVVDGKISVTVVDVKQCGESKRACYNASTNTISLNQDDNRSVMAVSLGHEYRHSTEKRATSCQQYAGNEANGWAYSCKVYRSLNGSERALAAPIFAIPRRGYMGRATAVAIGMAIMLASTKLYAQDSPRADIYTLMKDGLQPIPGEAIRIREDSLHGGLPGLIILTGHRDPPFGIGEDARPHTVSVLKRAGRLSIIVSFDDLERAWSALALHEAVDKLLFERLMSRILDFTGLVRTDAIVRSPRDAQRRILRVLDNPRAVDRVAPPQVVVSDTVVNWTFDAFDDSGLLHFHFRLDDRGSLHASRETLSQYRLAF